jgi:hypothetical protein
LHRPGCARVPAAAGIATGDADLDRTGDFDLGLGLVLDGLAAHAPAGRRVTG